jgi:Cytochrome P450
MTFDFIGDLAFAESFHNLETRIDHPFMAMIFANVKVHAILRAFMQGIPPLEAILKLVFVFTSKHLLPYDYRTFVHEKVDGRIKDGNRQRPDLMTGILRHNTDDGTGITVPEIEATTTVLIGAGSETTATLLSGCTSLLLRHPRVMEKLKHEIRSTFQSADDINVVALNGMPYILAVLEESLRVYPPVPIAQPRIVPPEGAAICGQFVPGNVGNPSCRWTSNNSRRRLSVFLSTQLSSVRATLPTPWTLYPNGTCRIGPRNTRETREPCCSPSLMDHGIVLARSKPSRPTMCMLTKSSLAYTEMKLMLARVLYDFDLELAEESKDWHKQKVYTLWEKGPLLVKVTERR